jgi:hypothetical protein
MKKIQFMILLVCVSIVAANAIHWSLAMLFYNGIMDVDALKNQSNWKYGEGWFEVGFFTIVAIFGFSTLCKIRNEVK